MNTSKEQNMKERERERECRKNIGFSLPYEILDNLKCNSTK